MRWVLWTRTHPHPFERDLWPVCGRLRGLKRSSYLEEDCRFACPRLVLLWSHCRLDPLRCSAIRFQRSFQAEREKHQPLRSRWITKESFEQCKRVHSWENEVNCAAVSRLTPGSADNSMKKRTLCALPSCRRAFSWSCSWARLRLGKPFDHPRFL